MKTFCCKQLDDNEKYELLVNVWTPDGSFKFPTSGKRNLKFQSSWLRTFPWLAYSAVADGAYCRICVLFGKKNVGKGRHENVDALVQSAFRDWKKALDKFKDHQSKQYHKNAFEDAQNFKLIRENQKTDVRNAIDQSRKQLQLENRRKLIPIIRTVILCGRQGLALRGHRDHGPVSIEMPVENDGNFKALLRFAAESGDLILQQHLKTAGANATYMSYRIQNEIIEAAGEIITKNIVELVNDSRCFTITADETTDISGIEQFAMVVRYVQVTGEAPKIHKLREDFVRFVPVVDLTGAGLAKTLLTTLSELKIDMRFMKGQG